MAEEKVYRPTTIEDTPFPTDQAPADSYSFSQDTSGGKYSTQKIGNRDFPQKRTAVELLSSALNTKSLRVLSNFQLTQSGGFQIGDYKLGESGQIDITPNGISAKDTTGLLSFVLDALTGGAVFRGTIQSGALIAGEVIVGNNRVIIDGENERIIINDGTNDRILIGRDDGGF